MAKIYTRRGDDGRTFCTVLGGRVDKDHPAIEALGALDELNSMIGVARALAEEKNEERYAEVLRRMQEELFLLGFILCGRKEDISFAWLEELIDDQLGRVDLKGFVLPSGGLLSSLLHYARTVCRRFERRLVSLRKSGAGNVDAVLPYVNRLSDALYAMAVRIAWDEGKLEYVSR